ncbi:unnamed protein product [Musa acuminata subsp. burmannicoides]
MPYDDNITEEMKRPLFAEAVSFERTTNERPPRSPLTSSWRSRSPSPGRDFVIRGCPSWLPGGLAGSPTRAASLE